MRRTAIHAAQGGAEAPARVSAPPIAPIPGTAPPPGRSLRSRTAPGAKSDGAGCRLYAGRALLWDSHFPSAAKNTDSVSGLWCPSCFRGARSLPSNRREEPRAAGAQRGAGDEAGGRGRIRPSRTPVAQPRRPLRAERRLESADAPASRFLAGSPGASAGDPADDRVPGAAELLRGLLSPLPRGFWAESSRRGHPAHRGLPGFQEGGAVSPDGRGGASRNRDFGLDPVRVWETLWKQPGPAPVHEEDLPAREGPEDPGVLPPRSEEH